MPRSLLVVRYFQDVALNIAGSFIPMVRQGSSTKNRDGQQRRGQTGDGFNETAIRRRGNDP